MKERVAASVAGVLLGALWLALGWWIVLLLMDGAEHPADEATGDPGSFAGALGLILALVWVSITIAIGVGALSKKKGE